MRAKRKAPAYVNHVLARACVGSNYVPCRQLWLRKQQGDYLLNPALRIQVADVQGNLVWQALDVVIGAAWLDGHAEITRKHELDELIRYSQPQPMTPKQLAAAHKMAPGMTEAELRTLRTTLERPLPPMASAAERERVRGLLEALAYIDRGEIGPWTISRPRK